MPVKTRSSNGRFESAPAISIVKKSRDDMEETIIPIVVKKETVMGLFKMVMILLLISPWIFILWRKNTFENVSKSISEFYDDNFSCFSSCKCDTTRFTPNSTQPNINSF